MRKYLLFQILFIIFTFSNLSFSQIGEGILIFKDGTRKEGRIKIKSNKSISLLGDKRRKRYNHQDLESFIFTDDRGNTRNFYYRKLKNSKKVFLLQKIISGKLDYFISISYAYNNGMSIKITEYFISRGAEDVSSIRHGPKFNKFSKIVEEYFNSCDIFMIKFKEGNFGNDLGAVKEMVQYFNNNC